MGIFVHNVLVLQALWSHGSLQQDSTQLLWPDSVWQGRGSCKGSERTLYEAVKVRPRFQGKFWIMEHPEWVWPTEEVHMYGWLQGWMAGAPLDCWGSNDDTKIPRRQIQSCRICCFPFWVSSLLKPYLSLLYLSLPFGMGKFILWHCIWQILLQFWFYISLTKRLLWVSLEKQKSTFEHC